MTPYVTKIPKTNSKKNWSKRSFKYGFKKQNLTRIIWELMVYEFLLYKKIIFTLSGLSLNDMDLTSCMVTHLWPPIMQHHLGKGLISQSFFFSFLCYFLAHSFFLVNLLFLSLFSLYGLSITHKWIFF